MLMMVVVVAMASHYAECTNDKALSLCALIKSRVKKQFDQRARTTSIQRALHGKCSVT